MIIVGIDPGITGGVSKFEDGRLSEIHVTPIIKGKGKSCYNAPAMADLIRPRNGEDILVIIESVHSMPGQGVASCFSFGQGYGMWLGMLAALSIPHRLVTPQQWQKDLLAGLPTSDPKQRGQLFLSQTFPGLLVPKKLVDAVLIGYWGVAKGWREGRKDEDYSCPVRS